MQELVPIKVKIGLRANGYADHPDWCLLSIIDSDYEVKQYAPYGWVYDKSCGHKEERIEGNQWDSPFGMQWGCLLVTDKFLQEAKTTFPELITEITEVEFEDFYNTKSRAHMSENNYNIDILNGLKLEYDLKSINNEDLVVIKAKIAKAVDPNDPEPGISKNKDKVWVDTKVKLGAKIKNKI